MKQTADTEMAPIQRTITKPLINTKSAPKKTISPKIIDLYKYKLEKLKLSLLCKGPKFTPTTKGNVFNSKSDIFNLTRWLQLEEILHEKEFNDKLIVYNKSNKQFKTKDLELEPIIKEIENIETEYTSLTSNISNEEQNALKNLRITQIL